MEFDMKRVFLMIVLLLLIFSTSCAVQKGFKIVEKPTDSSNGFISTDVLQMSGVGYPSPSTIDPDKLKVESFAAAVINARMRVFDYLLSELKGDNPEKFMALIQRIGQFSAARYEPIYSKELVTGGNKVDAIFETLGLKGYVHKKQYDKKTKRTSVVYRIIRAGLVNKARNGFSD